MNTMADLDSFGHTDVTPIDYRRRLIVKVILVALLVCVEGSLCAKDLIVPSADYPTIQSAIDDPDAISGDVIRVLPGTYYENIIMKDGITVRGSGAAVTTIDGGEQGYVVVFNSVSGTLSGFTITNSGNDLKTGTGIYVSKATVTIKNNVIQNNRDGIKLFARSSFNITGNTIDQHVNEGIEVNDSNGVINNNIISHNRDGIRCYDSSPSIISNTIAYNRGAGLSLDPKLFQIITNNIISSNSIGIYTLCPNDPPSPLIQISFNNVWGNSFANYYEEYGPIPGLMDIGEHVSQPFTPFPGTGEIHQPPLFLGDGNYHLQSQAGHWDSNSQGWIRDLLTSPCIDAGNPSSPIMYEPFPNGGTINMGAYGGTTEASKSYFGEPLCEVIVAGDINGDCHIDLSDFAIMASQWLR
jgi:parallel beta-helix repeat protein